MSHPKSTDLPHHHKEKHIHLKGEEKFKHTKVKGRQIDLHRKILTTPKGKS